MTARRFRHAPLVPLAALAILVTGCAALGEVLQPPVFQLAPGRSSQLRLLAPSVSRPLGGAEIQVWARVENPNPFGFTLTRLAGNVLLGDQPAADVDFPLGLPLGAAQDTVIPLNLTLGFADVPGIADRLRDALSTGVIDYALRGTVSVDAGAFGQPTFGPSTWLAGDIRVLR